MDLLIKAAVQMSSIPNEPVSQTDTLRQLIFKLGGDSPDAACIVSEEGRVLRWAQLVAQIECTHRALCGFGIGADDRVAIVLPNGPELAVAFLATATYAACAPLNPAYKQGEFAFYLGDLKARALITLANSADAIAAASQLGIPVLELDDFGAAPGLFTLKGDASGKQRTEPDSISADSVALLLHTSGTTSRPKLVPLRHRNLVASARNMANALQLSAADRCLNLMPLFHIHGLVGGLLAPLAARGSTICVPNLRPGSFFKYLDATRPTWFTAVPTMHRAIAAEAEGHEELIKRCPLRFIRSSSAPLSARLFDDLTRTFRAPVLEAYSMTEAAHQMTCNPLGTGRQKPGTVGLPAGPEVALMDEQGRILGYGETGEVVIRGTTVIDGYEANPEANATSFVNGWFRTGDQGRFDPDGYLVLTGRLKEQINRGGEKISPIEIDNLLLTHPHVSEAAAFGFPHPTLGEEIAAAVVPLRHCNVSPAQLLGFLREHLAPFKIPRRVVILEQMPKGPTGKVQRRQLRAILGIGEARAVAGKTEIGAEIGALEAELLDLWRRLLNCDSIELDDDFFEKGGDSLLALHMLLEVEKIVGYRVPESVLVECPTLQELARGVSEFNTERVAPLTHVQMNGTRQPFFLFHGDVNGGFYTRRLARLLGPDQPFISVAPHGLLPEPIPPSIEKMAADRLPLLLSACPHGPFRLGGYCNGAMVALETAHLLIEAGRRVELVVLIDAPVLNLHPVARFLFQRTIRYPKSLNPDWEQTYPYFARVVDRIWRIVSDRKRIWRVCIRRIKGGISALVSRASPNIGQVAVLPPHVSNSVAARERRSAKIYNRMFRSYFPRKIFVPVIYYSAEFEGGRLDRLSSSFETFHLPGGHWGCITTHADVLAAHLRERLDKLSRPPSLDRVVRECRGEPGVQLVTNRPKIDHF